MESYFDSGNRHRFGDCPLSYDPVEAACNEPCTEVVFAGERLGRLRARLADRATPFECAHRSVGG